MPYHAPKGLDPKSVYFWHHTLELLKREGTWSDLYLPLLEDYVRARQTAREYRDKIPEDGRTRGSQGQWVEDPAIKTMREAIRDAYKFGNELFDRCGVEGEALNEDDFDALLRGKR